MHVVIAKVDEVLYDGEAEALTVPGTAGEMTVLSHHEPLITTLKPGDIRVKETKNSDPQIFPVQGGVLEVRSDGATVIL
jgi:F-type H+-transporting ATPase subunit epsilon